MIRTVLIIIIFLSFTTISFSWDVDSARKEAFSNIERWIDISIYPSKDPHYVENLEAIRNNRTRVANRFITVNDMGYMLSELDDQGRQKITYLYSPNGDLLIVRLFSSLDFPRTEYRYCAQEKCLLQDGEFSKGELIRVAFQPEIREEIFYFNPDGSFDRKGN